MIKTSLIPILLLSAPPATKSPPHDDDVSVQLLDLREELVYVGRDGAQKDRPHFRALCDAEGFPLVGNVLPKDDDCSVTVPQAPLYQPSDFCEEIRTSPAE